MNNFEHIFDLPIHKDLLETLDGLVDWQNYGQICINTIPGQEDNHQFGEGSLIYDWDKAEEVDGKLVVPKRETPLLETDFTEICTIFKGTVFEEILIELKKQYKVGRVRIMKSLPKTCLTWHIDDTIRIHYPIKTQEGCLMIIEDEVKHLDQDMWWKAYTTVPHTAMNASKDIRVHLVVTIL